jgi:hypothetical protein
MLNGISQLPQEPANGTARVKPQAAKSEALQKALYTRRKDWIRHCVLYFIESHCWAYQVESKWKSHSSIGPAICKSEVLFLAVTLRLNSDKLKSPFFQEFDDFLFAGAALIERIWRDRYFDVNLAQVL